MSDQSDAFEATGIVKWYEKSKGYGFIACDASGEDMLLHANVLRHYGQMTLASGTQVKARAVRSAQGLQVIELLSTVPPKRAASAALPAIAQDADGELQPVRVKWFDRVRGFGFAEVYQTGAEAFLHVATLNEAGLTEVEAGEALNAFVASGDRGLVVRGLHKWTDAQGTATQSRKTP